MRTRREQLTAAQLMRKNPTEAIVDKDNHLRDALKYILLSLPSPSEKPQSQVTSARLILKEGIWQPQECLNQARTTPWKLILSITKSSLRMIESEFFGSNMGRAKNPLCTAIRNRWQC